jgi:GNAT superfamily N-acetyltransferase
MSDLESRPLDPRTWDDFAALVERHNGVCGGKGLDRRSLKHQRVLDGRAHAALVYDGERCVGWCQFGPTEELPRIKFARAYRAGAGPAPDWRITCFFVDREHRKRGVAAAALAGALREIARSGGGVVESSPEDVQDRKVSSSFLYNATVALFEAQGFRRVRPLGKNNWLVTKRVRRA